MARWMCLNHYCSDPDGRLGFPFEAEVPICPKCKTDGRMPRFRHVVIARLIIHFDPPSTVKDMGLGHPACNPRKPLRGLMFTGYPLAVTCEACMATPIYRKLTAGLEVPGNFIIEA